MSELERDDKLGHGITLKYFFTISDIFEAIGDRVSIYPKLGCGCAKDKSCKECGYWIDAYDVFSHFEPSDLYIYLNKFHPEIFDRHYNKSTDVISFAPSDEHYQKAKELYDC